MTADRGVMALHERAAGGVAHRHDSMQRSGLRLIGARQPEADFHIEKVAHAGAVRAGIAVAVLAEAETLEPFAPEEHRADIRVVLSKLLHIETVAREIMVEIPFPAADGFEAVSNKVRITADCGEHMDAGERGPLHVRQPAHACASGEAVVARGPRAFRSLHEPDVKPDRLLDPLALGGRKQVVKHVVAQRVERAVVAPRRVPGLGISRDALGRPRTDEFEQLLFLASARGLVTEHGIIEEI